MGEGERSGRRRESPAVGWGQARPPNAIMVVMGDDQRSAEARKSRGEEREARAAAPRGPLGAMG